MTCLVYHFGLILPLPVPQGNPHSLKEQPQPFNTRFPPCPPYSINFRLLWRLAAEGCSLVQVGDLLRGVEERSAVR